MNYRVAVSVDRDLFRYEKRSDGTATWHESIKTGRERVTVEVEVDVDAIASVIAWSAARNKTGRARFNGGKIRAKVVGRQPLEEAR